MQQNLASSHSWGVKYSEDLNL